MSKLQVIIFKNKNTHNWENSFFLKNNNANVYISTISLSKVLSNCFKSSYKSAFILMISIKLKGDLQPLLGSLGQFMFTKI
jgi:hypothetical protein